MAKVYKVTHLNGIEIVNAHDMTQVKAWLFKQFGVEITTAKPAEIFAHMQDGNDAVDLVGEAEEPVELKAVK